MIIPFIVISVGIALWLMLSSTWPADVLINLQAHLLNGKYYPKATFAVLWIGVVIIFFVILAFIDWLATSLKGNIEK